MKLSPHFTLAEFTRSGTAERLGIDNTPQGSALSSLRTLCVAILEPLRKSTGPLKVSSGYRSPEVNTAIKGSTSSQHCKGQAADVIPTNGDRASAWTELLRLNEAGFPVDQMIIYEDKPHIHVSCTYERDPRHQVLVHTPSGYVAWDTYEGPLKP
jgi:hypothetical protein